MNAIEERLALCRKKNEKAFVTYMTAGLPSMEGCRDVILAQADAGIDVIELGIPFSDPVADGPVIQEASYKSIRLGTNLKKVFDMLYKVREEDHCHVPVVFMMYYNTILYYGLEAFVERCMETGVDGLIVPDVPFEEQEEIQKYLDKPKAPVLIQLVAPVSKDRVPKILKNARGFVYCVSSMGVTGQDSGAFHKNISQYLKDVKAVSKVPVMMGFGIKQPKDVENYKEVIDGCIVGSALIKFMEENNYDTDAVKKYIKAFKQGLNLKE